MRKILGIYGSPRKKGNSDMLLDEALKGAKETGAEIARMRPAELQFSGCLECGSCDETGECILEDDMKDVYSQLVDSDIILFATPIFFYGFPAQAKALIDRSQALWCRRMLKKSGKELRKYESGRGYLLAVGATKGKNLFEGVELTAKYFFDALDMSYEGGLFFRGVEGKGAIAKHPTALKEAFDFGKKLAVHE